ncbi:HU family DNA-binding protein [Pseudooceanicola aestuarii]|uniref:HU family DNA-binding protein n=1 Tax=Pseudooceanicola aestuarii TaxID=2697319 RepID=UPI0013D56571|nr:HU family DNA-binding protein [Pseudooceanicola aestuarii]
MSDPETPDPVVTQENRPAEAPELLRKKELLEGVVTRSGIRKRDAKPVVEALLAELGDALAAGRPMQLPGFGKLRVNRIKDSPASRVVVARIRQDMPPVPGGDAPDEPAPGQGGENSSKDRLANPDEER